VKRYGCTDCGQTWSKKGDVPPACQSYTVTIRRDEHAMGGYVATCDPGELGWGAS